ncbi:hypothetical protein KKH13_02795 [Patescibacteria group bacterium]|nr:hypothetical protein [Patescibacteria group bacterium]
MVGQEALRIVQEQLVQEPSLSQLRQTAYQSLETYWQAFYKAIYVKHPAYIPLVATLMTQNPENVETHISGPVPLFFSPKPKQRQKIGMVDYREFNDHRAAIISLEQGTLNEDSLTVLLGLDIEQLKFLNNELTQTMERLAQIHPDDKLIRDCEQEIKDNPLWLDDEYLVLYPETLVETLQDLAQQFMALKRNKVDQSIKDRFFGG